MRKPRTVVVDDSRFMRGLISDLLDEAGVPVVGEAKDGAAALEVIAEEDPDAVTMDLEMPRMNGIEAVERIMAEHPTPVLMLSAHTEDGAEVTFEALEKGAVDFFSKPGGEVSMGVSQHADQLVATLRSVADADLTQASRQALDSPADVGCRRPRRCRAGDERVARRRLSGDHRPAHAGGVHRAVRRSAG